MQHAEGQARLCADISLNGKGTTLWFGVEEAQEEYLCAQRSDAFVMALLLTAMRGGHDMECVTPMSERLHYQLENFLIPSLVAAGKQYRPMKIHAPLTSEKVANKGAVGTAFSGGVDSLYTVMTHGKDSPYPLTHVTNFNLGVFEGPGYHQAFQKACANAKTFAHEMGLAFVGLDSNIYEVLPERYLDVFSFRLLAGALALQGLCSVYLFSSSHDFGHFQFDLRVSSTFDLLNVHCTQTESMTVYSAGGARTRNEKIRALKDWAPAHRWLHFCIFGTPGTKNCGKCKKCNRDMTALYALGAIDKFGAVIDLPAFYRSLPGKIGFVLANREERLCRETAQLIKESGVQIPAAAYVFEKQFVKALENLREGQK